MEKAKKSKSISFEDYLLRLGDESQPLSVASLYRLSSMSEENLDLFELAWPALPLRRRREIMQHLVDIAETNFEVECGPIFWIGLSDGDPEVRVAAIDGLWEEEDVKQVAPLLKMMQHDPSAGVRAAAAESLARFVLLGELDKIPQAHHAAMTGMLNALRAVIANPAEDLEVRRRAVEAIAYSGDEDVSGLIRDAYNSPEEKMRVSAVCGMGRSADNQWSSLIIRELESPNPEMRYEAARAAGELEVRKAVPILAELLDDTDREVQEVAVWALGQIGGKRAYELLHECSERDDDMLSEAAGEAIEEMALMHGTELPLFVYDADEEEDLDLDVEGIEEELDSDD